MSAAAAGPLDEMKDALQGILRGAAERVDLEGLRDTLDDLAARGRGGDDELSAEVISAMPLSDEHRAAITERLHERYGDDLPIRYREQPSILGGVIVRVGDRYIDGSVSARLSQLRDELTGSSAR